MRVVHGFRDTFKQIYQGYLAMFMGENTALRNIRMRICNDCEKKKGKWCSECGCFLEAKTRCFICECPLDKWYS